MTFICPKCKRYGMEWDGRAKVLICYYNTCNHVIRINPKKPIPSDLQIIQAIKKEMSHLDEIREGAVGGNR